MLIEPAKRFTALLESKDTISWSQDENELRKWWFIMIVFEKWILILSKFYRKIFRQTLHYFTSNIEMRDIKALTF